MKLLIATALLLPFASSQTVLETNPQECIDLNDYEADTDFFPEKFVPHQTTDLLTVTYHNSYKIITNVFQNKSYLLYQCGTEIPQDEVDSGDHHLVLSVPHTGGVAITQTTQIPPMEMLALRSDITTTIGNPSLISSPCMNHMMNEDLVETVYFPEDPYNSTLNDQGAADYLERNPDAIIFAGPTGNKDGDRHMAIAASQERTAVATFDWLGMYAALFNLEGKANEIIADTESRYKCSADNAAALTADIQQEDKPKILWAQYFSGIGWSMAACPTWDSAYYCEYAHHCGAEIISRPEGVGFNQTYGSPTVYWYVTDEEFLELGKDAETWIYPSKTFEAVYNEKKEILDQFKSVQLENVYDTQGQGPHGWHEQRLAEYDVVALDMCAMVGTNNPESLHVRRWFRSYFDEPIGNPGTCDAPEELDDAYIPAQAACTRLGNTDTTTEDVSEPDATSEDTGNGLVMDTSNAMPDTADAPAPSPENAPAPVETANAAGTHGVELAVVAVAGIVATMLA